MSSLRVQRIFEAMPNRLIELGSYGSVNWHDAIRWAGQVTATTDGYKGFDSCVIDLTDSAWTTLNKRVLIVAEPAMDYTQSQQFRTQSHAYQQFIDGSVRFHVYAESPVELFGASDAQKEYAKFLMDVQTHLVGQISAPVKFHYVDAGTEPTLDSVNGAGASAVSQDLPWSLPYGLTYPGGV